MTSFLRRIVPISILLLFLAGSTSSCLVVNKRGKRTRAVHKKSSKHRHRHCHVRGNSGKKVCHSHPHRHPHH